MVSDRERKVISTMVKRGLLYAEVVLFRTIEITAPPEHQRLLDRIKARQVVDDLHHAPRCPANHWHKARLVFRPCNCGAAKHAASKAKQSAQAKQPQEQEVVHTGD